MVARFGDDFESWQFQLDGDDAHEYSHQVVFRVSNRTVVSVTRNWEQPRRFDALFPERDTRFYRYSNHSDQAFSVAVRRLSGGRLLMAMGLAGPGATANQIVCIRETELPFFFPWLAPLVGGPPEDP